MYEFRVEKMSCGGCAGRVAKAIQRVDSAAKVDVDLKSKTVRVESAEDLAILTNAIIEAGYPVSSNAAN